MALLPSKPTVDRGDADPAVIGFGENADRAFTALQSGTARTILAALYEEPATASDLAEHVETSLQNIQHHLSSLHEADLVEVAETWYSSKGKEMKVYAPIGDPLMLVIGGDDSTDACRQALDEFDRDHSVQH